MTINFYKYQGTGNDFVLVDNIANTLPALATADIAQICHRRFGIGADGFMVLNKKEGYDFEMKYYNADGREGSMCGNGGRSIVQFAHDLGVIGDTCSFIAVDGPHDASIDPNRTVSLKMQNVSGIQAYGNDFVLNTGSPHYIQIHPDVKIVDVVATGKSIRYNADFAKEGINVNLVSITDPTHIIVRTYERGVEDETYSCGTGVTAAALVCGPKEPGQHEVHIETLGGSLSVSYYRNEDGSFNNIWLKGPAVKAFEGTYTI